MEFISSHRKNTKRFRLIAIILASLVLASTTSIQVERQQVAYASSPKFATIGFITWGNLSSVWSDGVTLASDPSLNYLTHIIAPAVVASSASSPTMVGMYGDIDSAFPPIVSAAHPKGIKVLPYFYTGGSTATSLSSVIQAGTLPTLVASIKNMIVQYDLDGIDLDIEEGINQTNNGLLIDALYAALNPLGKLITMDASYGEVPIEVPEPIGTNGCGCRRETRRKDQPALTYTGIVRA